MAKINGNETVATFGIADELPGLISAEADGRPIIPVDDCAGPDNLIGSDAGRFSIEAWLDFSLPSLESAITNGTGIAAKLEVATTAIKTLANAVVSRKISTGGPDQGVKASYQVAVQRT